jgi:hypothetical protein
LGEAVAMERKENEEKGQKDRYGGEEPVRLEGEI